MIEYLSLADARILLWLNHLLAGNPRLYVVGLFLTDQASDIAIGMTALVLWFWPHRVGRTHEAAEEATVRDVRRASRARLLVFGAGGVAAYIVARLVALNMDRPRPFASYLPVWGVDGAFEGLRTFGTFPSDHAALLGAVPVGFAFWSAALARSWVALGIFLMAVRVAVGFHYPYDMVAGAVIGMCCAAAAMALFNRSTGVRAFSTRVAAAFSQTPAAYVLYPLLVLGALEFAAHFKHVLGLLLWLRLQLG